MKCKGKYKEKGELFRAYSCEDYMIEKFLRQEMEMYEFRMRYVEQ